MDRIAIMNLQQRVLDLCRIERVAVARRSQDLTRSKQPILEVTNPQRSHRSGVALPRHVQAAIDWDAGRDLRLGKLVQKLALSDSRVDVTSCDVACVELPVIDRHRR